MPGSEKWKHGRRRYYCRWTAPREAIFNLLSRTSKHMSAKEIHAELYKLYPDTGLTTVYRTLDLLVRMELISKLFFSGGQIRYQFRSSSKKEHHHHLICNQCGRIIDYNEFLNEGLELVEKTEPVLTKKYTFKILNHNIGFYGLCEKCQ